MVHCASFRVEAARVNHAADPCREDANLPTNRSNPDFSHSLSLRGYIPADQVGGLFPIITVAALVLPETSVGITDASATYSPSRPRTRSPGSTTAPASTPMRQVRTQCHCVKPVARACARRASSLAASGPGEISTGEKRRNAGW